MIRSHLWFFATATILAALWAPWSALANSQACGIKWKQTFYRAKSSTAGNQAIEIRIGIPANDRRAMAQIWAKNGQSCQAICSTQSFERDAKLKPILLEMTCSSPGPVPLTTPATLFWPETPSKAPTLRFGTWLGGYSQTRLHVMQDHYSGPGVKPDAGPQLTPRKLAKVD